MLILAVLPFTVLVKSVTDCADARAAFAIAAFALDVTAVDRTPFVPSTSPLESKLNTASNLSKSAATDPAADVAVVVIDVANASATEVISPLV